MPKKLVQLFFGLVLMFAVSFIVLPVQAQAATVKQPVATIKIDSSHHQKANGWFNSVVMIKLKSNTTKGKIYFQWNSTSGHWQTYKTSFRAWRGVNTLYYYTVDAHGVKSAVKQQIFKVDYNWPALAKTQPSTVVNQSVVPAKTQVASQTVGKGALAAVSVKSSAAPEKAIQVTSTPEAKTQPQPENWSRLLVAISVLVIAVGVAIGGYYGYEALAKKSEADKKTSDKKNNANRW